MEQLSELVQTWSQGWRSLDRYQNSMCNPLRILATGYGLLMSGPWTLVSAAEALLAERGAGPNTLPSHASARQLQALCLGANFIVACHFDFESLIEAAA